MFHGLLELAAVLFVVWVFLQSAGSLIHLLWIAILVALALWVAGSIFRGDRSHFDR